MTEQTIYYPLQDIQKDSINLFYKIYVPISGKLGGKHVFSTN